MSKSWNWVLVHVGMWHALRPGNIIELSLLAYYQYFSELSCIPKTSEDDNNQFETRTTSTQSN